MSAIRTHLDTYNLSIQFGANSCKYSVQKIIKKNRKLSVLTSNDIKPDLHWEKKVLITVVALLLLIHFLLLLKLFCVRYLVCYAAFIVLASFTKERAVCFTLNGFVMACGC